MPTHVESRPRTDLELTSKITGVVARLSADDPDTRQKAVLELSQLDHNAIPLLEARLDSSDPEVRGRMAESIERIERRDPFFLVRLPDRRTNVHLKDVPIKIAIEELFRPFSTPPRLALPLGEKIPKRITLDLKHATFWQAVQRFAEVSSLKFSRGHDEWPEFSSEESERLAFSSHPGPFVAVAIARSEPATKENEFETLRLDVRLLAEPGWRPISASLKISSVKNKAGEEIVTSLGGETLAETMLEHRHREILYPDISVADLTGRFPRIPSDALLTVGGTARVTVVSRVESAEFRIDGFKGDEKRALGEMSIRVTALDAKGSSVQIADECRGPKDWKAVPGREYSQEIWVIAADDEGHSQYMGSRQYEASVVVAQGVRWDFPSHPTKVSYVRPMETQVIEIPVLIEGVRRLYIKDGGRHP